MKKILFFMVLSISFLFSAVNLQTASKDELMCLKGIGEKKADAIILYRKKNKLKSADDLIEIKGFGKGIIEAVKKGTKTVKCGGKKTTAKKNTSKKTTSKKADKSKKTTNKTDAEKTDTKKSTSKKDDTSKKVEKSSKKDDSEKPKKKKKVKKKKEDKKKEDKEDK